MARVYYDRQVSELLYDRNGRKVQGVSRVTLEGANPAFAQDDLVVSFRQNILGGHEPFLDSCRQPPLQKHGFADSAHGLQQFEILHVPGPDLHDIDIFDHKVDLARSGYLGDDAKPGLFAHLA